MKCLHCKKRKTCRAKGLCWLCYQLPSIREKYPPTTSHGRRGIGVFHLRRRPLPPAPTLAAPGTEAKIQVLIRRAELRQELWHPEDVVLPRLLRPMRKLAAVG